MMRALLVFAFLMLFLAPALAGERDSQRPPDLSRACPAGYSVVNGKCTPPCEQGARRNLAGRCVAQSCPQGQEYVGSQCVPKCPDGKKREGNACVNICGYAQTWVGGQCIGTGNPNTPQCGPSETLVGGQCVASGTPNQPECGPAQTNVGGNCVNTGNCPEGQERVGNDCKSKCLPKQVRDAEGICIIKCAAGQVRTGNFCHKPGQPGLGRGIR